MRHTANNIPNAQGVVVADADRDKLRTIVASDGETATIERLNISRHVLARCLAGLPVQRATAEYVTTRLRET